WRPPRRPRAGQAACPVCGEHTAQAMAPAHAEACWAQHATTGRWVRFDFAACEVYRRDGLHVCRGEKLCPYPKDGNICKTCGGGQYTMEEREERGLHLCRGECPHPKAGSICNTCGGRQRTIEEREAVRAAARSGTQQPHEADEPRAPRAQRLAEEAEVLRER